MRIKTLGYCAAMLVCLKAHALVPLEGLLQGEVSQDLQYDPLSLVFQPQLDSQSGAKSLHKLYINHYQSAVGLKQSCDYLGDASYASPSDEARARRSVVATLQYIGLDATVKAIGQYARTIQMEEGEYQKFTDNLTASSCSPNISVYGIKLIKQNLAAAFAKPSVALPTLPGLPFAPQKLTDKTNALTTKEQEFHQTAQLFRAFCSWGGDTNNYRLLPPLLSSPLVMSYVLRHMDNKTLVWNEERKEVREADGGGAIQVLCEDQICRRTDVDSFRRQFPRLVGSSGIPQDLRRMWCSHFRFQDLQGGDKQHPQIRAWIKKIDPEHEKQMVGQLFALFTGVPDIVMAAKNYNELNDDLRASVDERWDRWATQSLKGFSRDLLYEESLEIKVRPRRDPIMLRDKLFAVDLSVTMGELDRLMQNSDKISLRTELKVSRNWLRWLRTQWNIVNQKADPELRDAFIEQVASFLKPQVDAKQKYFPTPLFGEGLEQVLAVELIEQVLRYQGSLFDTLEDKMVAVPVRFHYGMFALSYMRYKAQIKARHKTLDL